MIWSNNEQWMLTGDHNGFVKYWQSNMNNVKVYQAHNDPVRGLTYVEIGSTKMGRKFCNKRTEARTLKCKGEINTPNVRGK